MVERVTGLLLIHSGMLFCKLQLKYKIMFLVIFFFCALSKFYTNLKSGAF